jgi:hypothetical protein
MTITAFLPVLVFIIGLVLYFMSVGVTKASVGETGRIMFAMGLLAFLIASGNSMQGCSIVSGGSGSSVHH